MSTYHFDAELVKIADAVADELRGLESQHVGQIYPERTYGEFARGAPELAELRVDVVPNRFDETDADSRESIGYVCSVDIEVRKFLGDDCRGANGRLRRREIDKLVGLVQEIHEFLFNKRLTKYSDAAFQDVAILEGYSRERLRNEHTFAGGVRVRFGVSKQVAGAR